MSSNSQQPAYVDRFYEMDPQHDDLIRGSGLADGMVVLIEDHLFRADPDRISTGDDWSRYEQHKARENNRWCTVSELHRYRDLVEFVGLYADGTKVPRRYNESFYWLVKKASLEAVTR
ncbi:hypothetical protein [Cellulomonas shaoxiangyii]|uniref:Uncharacterized protein n=1 Tax=Cellulomonas shaoxiangyii TaxID=2566013 RepID=A0A4P7SKQ5_9CELL|nr:hypothetical protein [Cellulomonas shaoxiangyii]QCB93334.1 hypothetical protein E5225_06980 [Cellulomonas shaoxiangyii]TGY79439.1 hypothetical protein E5226_15510 [Cellulomonas shaoxiangyii]